MSATETKALVERLRELAEKATPGPWEADSEKDENRVHYAVMLSPEGHSMFDSMNTDYRVGLIETESDGEYVDQWDETARRNFALIAELRNALPQILAALEPLTREPDADEGGEYMLYHYVGHHYAGVPAFWEVTRKNQTKTVAWFFSERDAQDFCQRMNARAALTTEPGHGA